MKKFTKSSNGYELVIEIDESKLEEKLDLDISEMEMLERDYGNNIDKDTLIEYGMSRVQGDYERDYCSTEEIINDRKNFIETVHKLIADNGESLWAMAVFKKNGTFKKNVKPVIKYAVNGSYWEESYGWDTLVLRLVPVTDTLARVELSNIVVHY